MGHRARLTSLFLLPITARPWRSTVTRAMSKTTSCWRELLQQALAENGETLTDIVSTTLTIEQLTEPFDPWGDSLGAPLHCVDGPPRLLPRHLRQRQMGRLRQPQS